MIESLSQTTSLVNPINRVMREVKTLSKNPNPEKTSWQATKNAILEAATFLRLQTHETVPYTKLREIARLRRIHSIEFFQDSAAPEAVLVPMHEGFIVRLRPNLSIVRNRASIAHEIGHTFFYDLIASPPIRLLAWGSSGTLSQKEENICWAFARELLMPRELITAEKRAPGNKSGLDWLFYLVDCFGVSLKLATFRLLWDLTEFGTAVVVFREVSTHGTHKITNPPKRYFGKVIRNRLRKGEREVLELVTKAIDEGPPYDVLDKIALQYRNILSLQWKVSDKQNYQGIVAFLDFHR